MTDADQNVSLKDVYDLVGETRKEISTQVEKVNGDVTDLKVSVGQIETKLDGHDDRIGDNTSRIRVLEEKIRTQRLRAAELGGVVGGAVTIILRIAENLLSRIP